jgi:hypothetical protein
MLGGLQMPALRLLEKYFLAKSPGRERSIKLWEKDNRLMVD